MKIAVDAYNIALEHGTGVATYGRNLISTIAGLGHETSVLYGAPFDNSKTDLLNEIGLFAGFAAGEQKRSKWRRRMEAVASLSTLIGTRPAQSIHLSGQIIIPPQMRLATSHYWNIRNLYTDAIGLYRATGMTTQVDLGDTEIVHWTYPLPIRAKNARNIYTLHDLVPLKLPYTTADEKRTYHSLCKWVVEKADHIVTVSESSKRDIIEILGVDEKRVTNTWQSTEMSGALESIDQSVIENYVSGTLGMDYRGYFLFFGAIEPKKNVLRMLEAYLGSGTKSPLVIVGAPGWGGKHETKLLQSMLSMNSNKRILWLDYLPRDMLAMLISGARATIFPSIYEGFGLPVLESMALGTPVICSNTSSLPEVVGKAALMADPYDVRSISAAIQTLDNDEDLRSELSSAGKIQALKFHPDRYREHISALYDKLS